MIIKNFFYAATAALLVACATVSANVYDGTVVAIAHDPVSYTIDGYNIYENCDSTPTLLVGDVLDGAVVSVDIDPIATHYFCVTAIVGAAETDVFASYTLTLTDIIAPANGTLQIEVTCKNPACTKVIVSP